LLRHEIEVRIMPSNPAPKPWTPPRQPASSQAAPLHPSHLYSGLYGHAALKQLASPGRLQKVLKVAAFREDIVDGLVYHIVGGCVDESGILIDLLGGELVQSNKSTDVAALVDFK
jgi:hypothetical protein